MSRTPELRLVARVAQLYHLDGMRQVAIAERLHLSQATVSRLLRRAEREGIVRISIQQPRGTIPTWRRDPGPLCCARGRRRRRDR